MMMVLVCFLCFLFQFPVDAVAVDPKVHSQTKTLLIAFNETSKSKTLLRDRDASFNRMSEGGLWKLLKKDYQTQGWIPNGGAAPTGFALFQAMSKHNLEYLEAETEDALKEQPFKNLRDNLVAFLGKNNIRLAHYTRQASYDVMSQPANLEGGKIMVKTAVSLTAKGIATNTAPIDEFGFGNDEFTFFFLELADSAFRSTRFTEEGKERRFAVPITNPNAAKFWTEGWIMLSDFNDREFKPLCLNSLKRTISTDCAGGAENHLKFPGKKLCCKQTGFKPLCMNECRKPKTVFYGTKCPKECRPDHKNNYAIVRQFEAGGVDPPDGNEIKTDLKTEMVSATVDSMDAVTRGMLWGLWKNDGNSKMVYHNDEKDEKTWNNFFVGADIKKGLALRTVYEIWNMAIARKSLARVPDIWTAHKIIDVINAMDDAKLISFLFRTMYRPQVMMPGDFPMEAAWFQSKPGT